MICPACLYAHGVPGDRCVACGAPLAGAERPRPFVGRGRALAWLDGQLEQVQKTGRPRFVAVAGQPGVGRSRLLEEFRRRHDNPFSDVEVLHGFPVKRARAADPFSPFGRLLHVALGIDERMGPEPRLARIREAIAPLQPPAEAQAVRGLAAVLGISTAPALDGPADPGEAFAAVRWYLAARARRAPLVMLLEGMDRASADGRRLYADLRVELDRGPVLVVAETTPAGVGTLGVAPGGTRVLAPLDREGVAKLLQALTDQPGAPPERLLDLVLMATGGNPGAVHEAAGALLAAGAVSPERVGWRLPDDVEALPPLTQASAITADLAALAPEVQAAVTHAAFIGPVCWVGALLATMRVGRTPAPGTWPDEPQRAAITDALAVARAAGILERRPDADLPGEPAWGFVSEAVHGTVQRGARLEPARPRHRIIAAWLMARAVRASPADLAVLAEHHEAGGDPGRAAEAWIEAGRRLGLGHAVEEAIVAYDRALACLEPTAAHQRIAVHHALGVLHDRAGRSTVSDACFQAMLADAWALDHRAKAGAALNRLGRSLRRQSRHADARRLLDAGRALFAQAGDVAGVAASVDDLGQVALLQGALDEAVERFREALEARREAGDERGVALSLTNIGRAMREAGDPDGAEAAFQEAASI
ncbi:MAG: tetratricopeptide repeat protein, partial [Myxococcales bacterium]|nr:tetratricopeptide repeat protein [Myxococcales bacterium]